MLLLFKNKRKRINIAGFHTCTQKVLSILDVTIFVLLHVLGCILFCSHICQLLGETMAEVLMSVDRITLCCVEFGYHVYSVPRFSFRVCLTLPCWCLPCWCRWRWGYTVSQMGDLPIAQQKLRMRKEDLSNLERGLLLVPDWAFCKLLIDCSLPSPLTIFCNEDVPLHWTLPTDLITWS